MDDLERDDFEREASRERIRASEARIEAALAPRDPRIVEAAARAERLYQERNPPPPEPQPLIRRTYETPLPQPPRKPQPPRVTLALAETMAREFGMAMGAQAKAIKALQETQASLLQRVAALEARTAADDSAQRQLLNAVERTAQRIDEHGATLARHLDTFERYLEGDGAEGRPRLPPPAKRLS